MNIVKVLNLSEEDMTLLQKTGKLLRSISDMLTSKEADVLSEDSAELISAIQEIATTVTKGE